MIYDIICDLDIYMMYHIYEYDMKKMIFSEFHESDACFVYLEGKSYSVFFLIFH